MRQTRNQINREIEINVMVILMMAVESAQQQQQQQNRNQKKNAARQIANGIQQFVQKKNVTKRKKNSCSTQFLLINRNISNEIDDILFRFSNLSIFMLHTHTHRKIYGAIEIVMLIINKSSIFVCV